MKNLNADKLLMPSFREVSLNRIKAKGFLLEFLERQRQGLSGNFTAQKYPFQSCLWEGVIDAGFWELDYRGNPRPIPGDNRWWPYEQTAYLLDGLLRLGLLLDDKSMIVLFRRNLNYLLQHPIGDRLGGECYNYHSEWPMGVFFKAVKVYLDVFDDKEVAEAFRRHYSAVPTEEIGDGSRNITNIEGLVDMAFRTGDTSLIEKAEKAYELFSTKERTDFANMSVPLSMLEKSENIVVHGVTLCEEIKIPVILYIATGKQKYLDAAERGWQNVMELHGQISGVPCSNEHAFGRDPEAGYESCVISDSLYTLGYFLMASGKVSYADQAEKIAYNALPGAVTKDFSALQYFSAPNQVVATPFSNSSSFLYGSAPLRQYRPDHFAACCPGNIHRAMPNFISRMFMESGSGTPTAVFFGPAEFCGSYKGVKYRISENTMYPFDGKIEFTFEVSGRGAIPFAWRIPKWCSNYEIKLNGKAVETPEDASGNFLQLNNLQNNDTLEINLELPVVHKSDRQWNYFEKGALVYSLEVKHSTIKEDPTEKFPALIMEPITPWNYAVDPEATAEVVKNTEKSSYPFDTAFDYLEVKAKKVEGAFAELFDERYTPQVPIFCKVSDEEVTLRLVPMGTTETRLTAFPDGKNRKMLPVLSAYTIRDTEVSGAEKLEAMAFRDIAEEIRVDRNGYFDLARFYKSAGKGNGAYLQVRFYAEKSCEATICVMISDGGIGYFEGEKIFEIPAIMEAEFMHPLWFKVQAKAGHNHIMLHVLDGLKTYDHREAWGALVKVFKEEN
ncbi:MAG: glycoside hydrolase family 127 protein [Lentisphaeria bacterium]|nr:glycoside hydrolase family 127 protein [Lentisphaeria bacterium]